MNKIIPAIIANSVEDLEKKLRIVEPYVDRVHLDIMDGDFVPNKTVAGYEEMSKLETKLNFDVHLMVNNPENQIYFWYQTKADRFLIHVESQADLKGLIDQIHLNNRRAGLVLNPDTPAEVIQEFVDDIDFVQFMTVDPGQYGADFREEVVSKIGNFHAKYPSMPIGVDGGVNPQTAPKLLAAGVSVFVVGSYIFSSEDVGKAITELQEAVRNS